MKGGYQYTRKHKANKKHKRKSLHKSKSKHSIQSLKKYLHTSKNNNRKANTIKKSQSGGSSSLQYSNWKSIQTLEPPPFIAGKMYCPNNPNTPTNYYGYETSGGVDPAVPENSIQAHYSQSGGSLDIVHYLPVELQNVIYSAQTGVQNIYNSFNGEPKLDGPNPLEGGIMDKDLHTQPSKEFDIIKSIEKNY